MVAPILAGISVRLPGLSSDMTDTSARALADAWRSASDDSRQAYSWWLDARPPERRDAFAVYRAALDREAAAESRLLLLTL
jgi:hypothetical protein